MIEAANYFILILITSLLLISWLWLIYKQKTSSSCQAPLPDEFDSDYSANHFVIDIVDTKFKLIKPFVVKRTIPLQSSEEDDDVFLD